MTSPIHHTGKDDVMDLRFCVLKEILELKKLGVYGSMIVKKKKYWPKDIDREDVIAHMETSKNWILQNNIF